MNINNNYYSNLFVFSFDLYSDKNSPINVNIVPEIISKVGFSFKTNAEVITVIIGVI